MNDLTQSRFIKACRREPTDATPIWLMRQAGRYMPEYLALRAKHSMLEVIHNPELACEVTLQPLNAFDLDAGIIFSDILPLLEGMGLDLAFIKGKGPVIHNPVRTHQDIEALREQDAPEHMSGTYGAIELVTQELANRNTPLIGFCGAPFTLACYAIQGQGSKQYEQAKALMYGAPESWALLMNKIVDASIIYLQRQAQAGASALQLFDSWAGLLSIADYQTFIQPYNTRLIAGISNLNVPVIHFSTGTGTHLDQVAACGGDVMGVDWRLPINDARKHIGNKAIQGNLDPTTLLAPWPVVQRATDAVLDAAGNQPGHIFNLGHGILPPTPVDTVKRLVDYVHERTTR